VRDKIFCQDVFTVFPLLPEQSVDLMFADPPYNLTKSFNDRKFKQTSIDEYSEWLDSWLSQTCPDTKTVSFLLYMRRLA
jgi:site-specific DNA-methyltransferase (adenine-specific)